MYLNGVTIPFIGQTFGSVPETQYDTVVVNEQWDGWANPPDRPWNLLADLNAVMGAVYTVDGSNDHSQTSLDSLSDAVKVSEITNKLGGTTTTYMVPRQQLPLTKPLLQLGVPSWVVDEIDKLLMPFIQAGYSSLTPNLGPHIERGQLVFTSPPASADDPMVAIKQRDLTPVETGIASATPNAAGALTLTAARSDHQATAMDGASSPGRQPDRQFSDAVDAGGSLSDHPEPEAAHLPRSARVRRSADADIPAQGDRRQRQAADAADAGASLDDDAEHGAAHLPRSARVRESAHSDSTADVHGEAKPCDTTEPGIASVDASAHDVSAPTHD